MRLLPRSASGWTMAVFGILAAVMGVMGLVAPDALLTVMGFTPAEGARRAEGDHTLAFLAASSMAALDMGVYYVLAALSDWKAFFRWTVPFRLLTCTVFTLAVITGRAPSGFLGVGLWEGTGAVVTGVALRHERRAGSRRPHETLSSATSRGLLPFRTRSRAQPGNQQRGKYQDESPRPAADGPEKV